jgi:hypothetical protein
MGQVVFIKRIIDFPSAFGHLFKIPPGVILRKSAKVASRAQLFGGFHPYTTMIGAFLRINKPQKGASSLGSCEFARKFMLFVMRTWAKSQQMDALANLVP